MEEIESLAQIKVVGVGGGGGNAVNRMAQEKLQGVEMIAVNTDAQALVYATVPTRVRIGDRLTGGLGAGGDPHVGMLAAEESHDELLEILADSDMVFITAGLGGGTGTGGAPVIAEIAKEAGALSVGVVTLPFSFEGEQRHTVAREGLARFKKKVDTLIVIPNDRLLTLCEEGVSVEQAFRMADEVLFQGIQAISDLVLTPGTINLDFSDVRTIMSGAGPALMAIGRGVGESRATDAARSTISSPLLGVSIEGAKRILFNITGSDLTLFEVNEAANIIKQAADPDAKITFGLVNDPRTDLEVKLTLIATGFPEAESKPTLRDRKLERAFFFGERQAEAPPFLQHLFKDVKQG